MFPESTEENCWVGAGPRVGTDKLTVVREQGLGDLRERKKRRRKRERRGRRGERERKRKRKRGKREKVMIGAELGFTMNSNNELSGAGEKR